MPSFFQFTQGTESRFRPNDTSPLLGRFRAVPPRSDLGPRRHSSLGLLAETLGNGRGSVHVGYGAVIAAELGVPRASLLTVDAPTYTAEACPLCAAGSRAEKPGSRA